MRLRTVVTHAGTELGWVGTLVHAPDWDKMQAFQGLPRLLATPLATKDALGMTLRARYHAL